MIVQADNEFSDLFKTTVGVKQGGLLSPKLFLIYVEDLTNIIKKLNEGVA